MDREKVNKALGFLQELGLSQMLVSDPAAIFYMTGKWIHPGERFLALYLRAGAEPVLILNELFQFPEDIGVEKRLIKDTDDITKVLSGIVDPGELLGIDKTMQAKFLLAMMEHHTAAGFRNGSPAVDRARAIKDREEQRRMIQASKINDAAMAQFKTLVKEGVTEQEIADQMLSIYQSLGATAHSFPPIVSFGTHASDPHHEPDDTRLQEGDIVLFDVGCVYENYCSDMTRTFFYKREPGVKERTIYNTVRRANEEAEAMLRPGIPLCSIDKKARDIITEAGYGPYFTHRLGHFIGIEDHEYGDVSSAFQNLTEVGNTFSIEPGIYLPQGPGTRIEDLVLITKDGYRRLNDYPKDIEVLG